MPENKYLFGVVKIGAKGQIVIPKSARSVFSLSPGDELVVLGDSEKGIALMKTDDFARIAGAIKKDN